jgi:hypothetical protein
VTPEVSDEPLEPHVAAREQALVRRDLMAVAAQQGTTASVANAGGAVVYAAILFEGARPRCAPGVAAS